MTGQFKSSYSQLSITKAPISESLYTIDFTFKLIEAKYCERKQQRDKEKRTLYLSGVQIIIIIWNTLCEQQIIGVMAKLDEGKIKENIQYFYGCLTSTFPSSEKIPSKLRKFSIRLYGVTTQNTTIYCKGSKTLRCQIPTKYLDY